MSTRGIGAGGGPAAAVFGDKGALRRLLPGNRVKSKYQGNPRYAWFDGTCQRQQQQQRRRPPIMPASCPFCPCIRPHQPSPASFDVCASAPVCRARLLGGCSCTCVFATGWLLVCRARLLAGDGGLELLIVIDHNHFMCLHFMCTLRRGSLLTTGRMLSRHPVVVGAGRDVKVSVAGRSVGRAPGKALPSACGFSVV
jgi:hypothetical protein